MATVMSRPMMGRPGVAECCASVPEKYCQGCEFVGTGVQAVGDQSDRSDAPVNADAIDRDEFVADESDQCGVRRPSRRGGSGRG